MTPSWGRLMGGVAESCDASGAKGSGLKPRSTAWLETAPGGGRACKTAPGGGHIGPTKNLVKGGSVQHLQDAAVGTRMRRVRARGEGQRRNGLEIRIGWT